MYCDKENVNLLTARLIETGIKDIVVSPGSRNAVLIHNFYEASKIDNSFRLHPVTDERSAAFFAIGIWIVTHKPVAVCVTSGSALLNTLPAVAEAFYRQIPLVVISADRPQRWIGQLDGQTIPQPGALRPYTETFSFEKCDSESCNRQYSMLRPLHINVPIEEPLFSFTTKELPRGAKSLFDFGECDDVFDPMQIAGVINNSELPAVVMGQYESGVIDELVALDRENKLLLLPEIISNQPGAERTATLEAQKAENIVLPTLVLHIGGNLVNKWLKLKLRRSNNLRVIRVDETNDAPDTFSHLERKVKCNERNFFKAIAPLLRYNENVEKFKAAIGSEPQASSPKEQIVVSLYDYIKKSDPSAMLFLGNSSVVRIAARLIESGEIPIYCNRGVNGIEGSVSVAAGCASVYDKNVYVIVGDLSFFYDVNSLWNSELNSNLRVVLLNDHGGAIFSKLDGLNNSAALDPYISARHNSNAHGIALSYGCDYYALANDKQLEDTLHSINMHNNNNKPIIIEYDTYLDNNQTV